MVPSDRRPLSSVLRKWETGIVFSAIIGLAVGAIVLERDDEAREPILIGVSIFDSATAESALERFAEFCRREKYGDLNWRYLGSDRTFAGCDFYLMTSLDLSAPLARGDLGCALIAAEREAHRYSRSAVLVKAGVTALPERGARIIFGSSRSAAGYLAPCRALERAGYSLADASIEFAGAYPGDEPVVFGVLFGAYDAGGISFERLQAMKEGGVVRESEIDVLCEGEGLPEIILAYDPASYSLDRMRFVKRLPGALERSPAALRSGLSALGIAGLYAPRRSDLDLIKELDSMIPRAAAAAPGGRSGAIPTESGR